MKAWLLARKDLRIFFRDRTGMLLGLGLPIVLATVFGAAMGSFSGDDEAMGAVELLVEDLDGSEASRALVAELQARDGLEIELVEPGKSARDQIAEGDAPAALSIGPGYGASLASGADLPLTLYRDPGKLIEQQIIAGNLLPALVGAGGEGIGRRAMARVLDTVDFPVAGREAARAILEGSWDRMAALAAEVAEEDGASDAVEKTDDAGAAKAAEGAPDEGGFDFATAISDVLGLRVEDVAGSQGDGSVQKRAQQSHAVAGVAVMMLLFGLVACGGTLLEEKEEGTLDRLRLSPGGAVSILGGKFLFTWTIGIVQLVILFLYASVIFDVPIFRAPLALFVLSSAVAAAATGFGVFLAVVCRTRAQLEGFSTILILTMSAAGGSWWPLVMTPDWYQFLGHFTLNAWAMDGYQAIFWYGQGLGDILPELAVLAGIALATSLVAVGLWNKRVRV